MCQQILDFCNEATKPLIFTGALLAVLVSLAIGYTSYTTHDLFETIDWINAKGSPSIPFSFYLQIFASVYLLGLAVHCCLAAYYDQKHAIRTLAVVSTLNCILAIAVILFIVPTGDNLKGTLKEAINKKIEYQNTTISDRLKTMGCCEIEGNKTCTNQTPENKKPDLGDSSLPPNGTARSNITSEKDCSSMIENACTTLEIVIIFIALVNLYLATVTAIISYRTIHYDEASQRAYT